MKNPVAWLFTALFLIPFVFADCPYVEVSSLNYAHAQTGVQTLYPITLTNAGVTSQLVSLTASCDIPLRCSFDQAPYSTLAPTQSATFYLRAESNYAGIYPIPVSISAGTSQDCDGLSMTLNVTTPQPTVQPSERITFSLSPEGNQSARPGEEIAYSMRVKNNDAAKAFVQFTSQGGLSSSFYYSASDIELAPGQEKTVDVTVRIPPGTPSNIYQNVLNLRLSTNDGAQYYYTFPMQIFVYSEKLNLVLQNEPVQCIHAIHNEETKWRLKVRNDGEIEGPFQIDLYSGAQASKMLGVFPKLLEVKRGDYQEVELTVSPPQTAVVDNYSFQFTLSYNGVPVFARNYCFDVYAKVNFTVEMLPYYSVDRGQVRVLLPFNVTNTGSVAQSFAIELRPPSNLLAQPEPRSFTLGAGEKKQAFIAITPSRNQALGTVRMPAVVRTPNIAKAFSFNITVLPEGQQQPEHGIDILHESLRAYAGGESKMFLTVRNNENIGLHNALLWFEGIPREWASVQQTVLYAGETQGILVVFNVPPYEKADAKEVTARITSTEGVTAEKPMTLFVEVPQSKMEFTVVDSTVVESAGSRDLYIHVIVKNSGQRPLYEINAESTTGLVVGIQPEQLFLQPGQTAEVVVKVQNPKTERIPLTLKAADGTKTDPVSVSTNPKTFNIPWLWIMLAIIAVLAIIYFVFVRKQEQYA